MTKISKEEEAAIDVELEQEVKKFYMSKAAYEKSKITALHLIRNKKHYTPHEAASFWCGRFNPNDELSAYLKGKYDRQAPSLSDSYSEMYGEELDDLQSNYDRIRTAILQHGTDNDGVLGRQELKTIAGLLGETPEFLTTSSQPDDEKLHHKERNSLYSIIAGLRGVPKDKAVKSTEIQYIIKYADQVGLPIDEKTVRKHLKLVDQFILNKK